MNNALWFWELVPGKDYWITLRDCWMLYCASRPHTWVRQYTELFDDKDWTVGTTLRIKLPQCVE